ncbi:MAG: polysaccharide biosynthesis tyrosine autokinase [Candidatus Parvarchaeota archaeon]|nr:polysaccharide biosynthesis tyrosine autokinase [Candidatus Jingweiarchaeum tengchongense]
MEQAISTVQSWVTVSQVQNTNIVQISVQNANPTLAASVANDLAIVYNNQLRNLAKQQYALQAQFIESQIPSVETSLNDYETQIRNFEEQNGVYELNSEASFLFQALTSYDQQINTLETSLAATQASIQGIQKLLSNMNMTIVSATSISVNPLVTQLESKLIDLKVQLASVQNLYPPTDQRVTSIQDQIIETQNELKKQVADIVSGYSISFNPLYQQLYNQLALAEYQTEVTNATIQALKKVRAGYETKLQTLPAVQQKLTDLNRQLSIQENLYTLLLQNLEETKISEAGVTGNIAIIDTAYTPMSPVKPNKKLDLAIGLVLGIFLGFIIIFIVEYADRTLKEENEIERITDGIPIVGRIPKVDIKNEANEVFVAKDPTSPSAEAIKIAVTNIIYSSPDKLKTILITSSTPQDGKTLICANMAQAFAQNGQKTLIIDLDMRRPRIEEAFGLKERSKVGVTNCIISDISPSDAIINISDNLDILSVGPLPPNPTSILTSPKLAKVIKELEAKYDRIIIDSPPVIAAADAGIISHLTDGVVLVVKVGQTTKDALRLAISNLMASGAKMLGTVINGVSSKGASYYYYYYYYTKDGEKKRKKRTK